MSDINGRVLIIEPGIGCCEERKRYSLITNYSVLKPESTKEFVVLGDDRYQRALEQLDKYGSEFSVSDAFNLLKSVRQEGMWATRVSFVYSAKEHAVYYAENNQFENIKKLIFS